MQGGIRSLVSHGSLVKQAVLQHVRVMKVNPLQSLMLSRHESTSAAPRMEEHGFESTTISDILKGKGKGADGSWLWCTTDDSVYDAVKSVFHSFISHTHTHTKISMVELKTCIY